MRGPQRWQLLAPRIRQIEKLRPAGEYHTSSPHKAIVSQTKFWDAWKLLARPVSAELRTVAMFHEEDAGILTLPAELMDEILDLPLKEALLSLGSICEMMSAVVAYHVEARIQKAAAPWGGQEMACTGNYLVNYPKRFTDNGLVYHATGLPGPVSDKHVGRNGLPYPGNEGRRMLVCLLRDEAIGQLSPNLSLPLTTGV